MLMTPAKPYPTLVQALGLLLLVLLLQLFLGVVAGFAGEILGIPLGPVTLSAVNLASFAIVLALGLHRTGATAREVFPLRPIRPGLVLPIVMTTLGLNTLMSEADNLLNYFLPRPAFIEELFRELLPSGTQIWATAMALVIVAPLTEELLFRGLILRGFLLSYTTRASMLLSAFLFAALHVNPWQFLPAFTFGLVLAWWFVHTRSLVPCLLGHALNNGIPVLLIAFPIAEIPGYTGIPAEGVAFQPVWFTLLGLALFGAGMTLTARQFRAIAPPAEPPEPPLPAP